MKPLKNGIPSFSCIFQNASLISYIWRSFTAHRFYLQMKKWNTTSYLTTTFHIKIKQGKYAKNKIWNNFMPSKPISVEVPQRRRRYKRDTKLVPNSDIWDCKLNTKWDHQNISLNNFSNDQRISRKNNIIVLKNIQRCW